MRIGSPLIAIIVGRTLTALATDLTSNFTADTEGWRTSTNAAAVSWQGSGGAPDGYLQGGGANHAWHFVSPTNWAGDWTSYQVIKFDLAIVNRQYADAARNNIVVLLGANGVELASSGLSPEFTWTHYEVQLQPSSFQVDQATFDSVLRGVAELRILGEYTTGSELVGLDNVVVTAQGPANLTNDLMSTFNTDSEGWRPVDDVTLSHTTTEFAGHIGGALKGEDWMDGRVWWFATPVSWAGNWQDFKTLMFDIGTISPGSVPNDAGPNVRILGANGGELVAGSPPSGGTWQHYNIPLKPETFGVTQAYFNGVMSHVVEMRIRGEWTGGDDIELLDNVIVTRELRFPLVDHDLVANFDADAEGWRVVGNGTPQWGSSGGNPGGFLRGFDGGEGVWYFVAPESWAGDWSLFKQMRFQLKYLGGVYGGGNVDTVHLRTYDGQELIWVCPLQASSWTPHILDLTPANFGVDRTTFDSAIRNVKELWIRGETTAAGDDSSGLDSLVVSLSDAPIIPPDRRAPFDGGTDGWRPFGGLSLSWQSQEGNPGGFLQGVDEDADRWGFASPDSWCGDWRSYRLLAFDYRIVSGTYSFGAGDFIYIYGLNGTNLIGSIIPPDNNSWKHYDIVLAPATFGVDRETYEAVMKNVVQVVLLAETVSGWDAEAIDNVLLTKASSPYLIWRDQYWTGPDRDNESLAGVLADPDGDGANNWNEFTAGTVPTNRLDFFRIESVTARNNIGQVVLKSQPGHSYGLEARSSLDNSTAWSVLTNHLPGTGERLRIPFETGPSNRLLRATVDRQD